MLRCTVQRRIAFATTSPSTKVSQIVCQTFFNMGLIERSAVIKAKPETIWKLYAPVEWIKWDPDVKSVENVSGEGFSQGMSADMMMHNGMKFTATFPVVKENEYFEMTSKLFGGLVKCQMSHKLEAKPEGTLLVYKFGFAGPLGGLLQWAQEKPIVDGTEDGLKNIVEMSEAAEKGA